MLNNQSLNLRKNKCFNPADDHLLLLHDWFWVNILLHRFVHTILAYTVYTHVSVLASAVVGAICQAGPQEHACTAGPGFWSTLLGTRLIET